MQGGQAEPIRVYMYLRIIQVHMAPMDTVGHNSSITLVQIPTHPDHDWTPGVPNTPCLTE